ncbi:LuxR family transcriptional regulator [Nocardia sputorum]|nr:LuxR family transcriptional regulator [Nocardia sputorum]
MQVSNSGIGSGSRFLPEALALFADRAKAIEPDFKITSSNREHVEEICQRLDGIPLALELAAAQMRALSPMQLLARLDQRFELLADGSPASPARHRTLKAALDWSFELCSEDERILWSRLSVFSGSFDLESVEAVCVGNGWEPADLMALIRGLVDKSVLARESHYTDIRFRLLESIRFYGLSRLRDRNEEDETRLRHREWFVQLAARIESDSFGPRQLEYIIRLRTEYPNLQGALDLCLSDPSDADTPLCLASSLWFQWVTSGRLSEGKYWLEKSLARAPESATARVKALWISGWISVLQGDNNSARLLLRECRALVRRYPDENNAAMAKIITGVAITFGHDVAGGARSLERSLACPPNTPAYQGILTVAWSALAWAYAYMGDTERAVSVCRQAVAKCEGSRESWSMSWALVILAVSLWKMNKADEAVAVCTKSLLIKRDFNDVMGIVSCLEYLGWFAADTDGARCAVLVGAADTGWRTFGTPHFGMTGPVADQARLVRIAQHRIGAEAFAEEFSRGAGMSLDAAVDFALGRNGLQMPEAVPFQESSPLTKREQEVAELIAQGLSNQRIARALLVSQRTAESHVEHILTKLGFVSRAQVAAWVVEQKGSSEGPYRRC